MKKRANIIEEQSGEETDNDHITAPKSKQTKQSSADKISGFRSKSSEHVSKQSLVSKSSRKRSVSVTCGDCSSSSSSGSSSEESEISESDYSGFSHLTLNNFLKKKMDFYSVNMMI